MFCPKDYDSVRLLCRFADNKNNEWIKIDNSLDDALSSAVFCKCDEYDKVKIYYKSEEFLLFQIETRKEFDYIRINPKIYPEFQKQFHVYQKKGMI